MNAVYSLTVDNKLQAIQFSAIDGSGATRVRNTLGQEWNCSLREALDRAESLSAAGWELVG